MGLVFEVKMGTEGSNDRKPTVTLGKLCCKCFLRAKMGADVVWWKTQMVDFGQWVSYVEYGHNAKHTFFLGGGEPNLDVLIPISWDTSFFPITVTAGYWNSKRNTDQSTLFIYMHVLYMFVYSMDWFEDVWGNNVLLVKKNRGAGSWLIPSIIIYRLFFRGKPSETPLFSSTNFNGKRTSIEWVPLSIFPWSNSTRVRTSNHPLGHANPLMSKQCPLQVWNDRPFKSLQPLWLNYSIQ